MRRALSLAMAGLFVLLVSATQAQAQVFTLTAALSGSNETPAPIVTGAFGTATVTVDVGTRTVTWTVIVFNMPSGTSAGHIHVGGVGVGGPTIVTFTIPAGISNDYSFSGSATASNLTVRENQGIRSWEDAIQAILGGNTYVNVHSAVNGGGEIRGQLRLP